MNRIYLWLCLALVPLTSTAVEIDFTRHLGTYAQPSEVENFFGVPGGARMLIDVDASTSVTVTLNGEDVVTGKVNAGLSEVPVTLIVDNSISVNVDAPASVVVRIKQVGNVELQVKSRIHFNTNVSDFTAAREFYGKLGFETLTGFPDTNTQAMARAIGIETPTEYDGSKGDHAGGYLLHGELIGPDGFWGGVIDLIEFTIPRNDEPPYPALNRLGMVKAAMVTTDLDADYAYLIDQGVEFLSEPEEKADGSRFAIFRDLDGTFYELLEEAGEQKETETTQITRMGHVTINVSDLERSSAWYQMMGFEVSKELTSQESASVANAMGFDEPFEIRGQLVKHQEDQSELEIVQWLDPYDAEPPFPVPINHLGIHRIAFMTTDIEGDVAALKAQGVEFISPITPCCSGDDSSSSIVAFYDPDGTIVELADQPYAMYLLFQVINWFREIF